MQQHPNAGIEEFKKKSVEYLNILLGQSEQAYMYWEFDLIRVSWLLLLLFIRQLSYYYYYFLLDNYLIIITTTFY
jgi:hypothetical protein